MPRFVKATVDEILEERAGLQRVSLARDGGRAYVLTDLIGPVAVGDAVVVNTTAVDLGLGTGGWHVVHWNLSRDEWGAPGRGHVMKLRYTSEQVDVGVVEEDPMYRAPASLTGTPVVACVLHSQLPAVVAGIKHVRRNARVAYVMSDSAALPIALSDTVFELQSKGLLQATVTAGQAFGGEYETVNVMSGLGAAVALCGADVIVVAPGPGVVGTGTKYGFGSLEIAGVLDVIERYGGVPYLALRWSDADGRERHRGLSHHATTILETTSSAVRLAVPRGVDIGEVSTVAKVTDTETETDNRGTSGYVQGPGYQLGESSVMASHHVVERVDTPEVRALLESFDLHPTSMGRSVEDDPTFYAFAAATGMAAAANLE